MGSRTTKEEKKEILELYNGGATIKEIAELTEKKYDTIWHLIRRNETSKEPTQKKVLKEEKNTAFDARRNTPAVEKNEPPIAHISRGEIYFISKAKGISPQQQEAGRPAIIVSNNKCNQHSDRVEVVYLTTQEKNKDLPTHVTIFSTGKKSTALCENIQTIYKDRIENYYGKCTEEEMTAINVALVDSIGLKFSEIPVITDEDYYSKQSESEVKLEPKTQTEDITNQAVIYERDIYKKLYEDLLERVIMR